MTPSELDAQRLRWVEYRRERTQAGSHTPGSDSSLVPLSSNITAQICILPADPSKHLLDFDNNLLDFWKAAVQHPATGELADWGSDATRTVDAMLVGYRDGRDLWQRYAAVFHNGAAEGMLSGRSAAYTFRRGVQPDEIVTFRLASIVSRLWHLTAKYQSLLDKHTDVKGPWELTIFLSPTTGSTLGHFASGWAEPTSGEWDINFCASTTLSFRREFLSWPQGDDAKEVVFSIGSQIEDAYHYHHRRFIRRNGTIDPESFRWAPF